MEQEELLFRVPALLLEWYDREARVLPWRENTDPYRVWVSEIMLQQTRVEAVMPYYERFLSAFPTLADLAAAPEEQLLKLWEGLGYYSRARNLQKAAREALERFGGLPGTVKELSSLPGIGAYTAGAVASIAFSQPVPAVDGNVLRVFARLTDNHGDVLSPSVRRESEKTVSAIIPKDRPGDFNQAVMDLGATVCLPGGAGAPSVPRAARRAVAAADACRKSRRGAGACGAPGLGAGAGIAGAARGGRSCVFPCGMADDGLAGAGQRRGSLYLGRPAGARGALCPAVGLSRIPGGLPVKPVRISHGEEMRIYSFETILLCGTML